MSGTERAPLEFRGGRTAELIPDQLIFPAVPKLPDVIGYRSPATVRACPGVNSMSRQTSQAPVTSQTQ